MIYEDDIFGRKKKELLEVIERRMDELSQDIEKMKIAEYVEILNDMKRLLYINFVAGLARGIGMAIGFTVLGAVVLYSLSRLALLNLPIIGDFIAEIVKIVQDSLY
ncbi:MAG: DUF5665 domain-containing protein [Clostridia bacterium]|nr:DUF5665 domain-containing protein [Clostridia bacterium]